MSIPKPVPYQGKEPYIFISYAHKDMDTVYSIISSLIEKGLRIWFDEGIDPGTEWDDNIAAHVQGCDSMIAFISANYLNSDNCRDELNYARDLKKDRLLIYLEHVDLPAGMAMRMNRIQAINRYNYDDPEDFRRKLMCCQFILRSMGTAAPEQIDPEETAKAVPGPASGSGSIAGAEGADALVEKGLACLSGRGVEKDYNEAVRLFRLAAEQNDPAALYNLGRAYATGRGVPQDYPEAVKWHKKAAELNQVESQHFLGHAYLYGRPGVEKDPAEAVRWYTKAAMQGDSLSQNDLGECCENGWGVQQDYAEAVRWYLKSAEGGLGCDIARYHLGRLYLTGDGVDKDYGEAVRWLEAAGRNLDAVNLLGTCYENGYGVIQDPEKAAELYQQAAKQEHVTAQYNLGNCYLNGSGVEKNVDTAFYWYRKAAENTVSFSGNSPLWAVDKQAAKQGQKMAQAKLAECYRKGIGVWPNEEEARKWEKKATD